MSTSALPEDICELNNKKMAFLVTEIAMELMGCKYFDADGLPVSEFEDLVKYNRAGLKEKNPSKQKLEQYLAKEIFYDAKGLRVYIDSLNMEPPSFPPESVNKISHPPIINKTIPSNSSLLRQAVPRITCARSLAQPDSTPKQTSINQQLNSTVRRPSFLSQFSSFISENEKKEASNANNTSSLLQRSMTQFGNRKIIIKPKTLVQKGVPIITVPVKTIPKKVTPILPKVVSVRQAVPMGHGSGGTHFRGPFSVISGAVTTQQRTQPRFEPPPIVSGGVGTQFGGLNRNEPAPAISGGGGTQFGGPSGLLTKAITIEPPPPASSAPKVSRILHRRNTLFHKGPY